MKRIWQRAYHAVHSHEIADERHAGSFCLHHGHGGTNGHNALPWPARLRVGASCRTPVVRPYIIVPQAPKDGDESKPATAGHCIGPLAAGLSGASSTVWRLSYKAVHSKLHHTKPLVLATNELTLEKGKPVHVGGPGVGA